MYVTFCLPPIARWRWSLLSPYMCIPNTIFSMFKSYTYYSALPERPIQPNGLIAINKKLNRFTRARRGRRWSPQSIASRNVLAGQLYYMCCLGPSALAILHWHSKCARSCGRKPRNANANSARRPSIVIGEIHVFIARAPSLSLLVQMNIYSRANRPCRHNIYIYTPIYSPCVVYTLRDIWLCVPHIFNVGPQKSRRPSRMLAVFGLSGPKLIA